MFVKFSEVDEMPFDRDGMHATGRIACFSDSDDPLEVAMNTWYEYVGEDGSLHYMR